MATNQLTTQQYTFLDDYSGTKDTNPNYLCTVSSLKLSKFTNAPISIIASLPQEFSLDIGAAYEEAMAQAVASNSVISEFSSMSKMSGVQLATQALTAQMWQGSTDVSFSIPLVFQVESDEYKDVLLPIAHLYELVLPDDNEGNGLLSAPGPQLDAKQLAAAFASLGSGALNTVTPDFVKEGVSSAVDLFKRSFNTSKSLVGASDKTASAPQSPTAGKPAGGFTRPPLASAIKNNISLQLGHFMFFESVVVTSVNQTPKVQPLASGNMSRIEVTVGFKTFYTPTQKDIMKIFTNLSAANSKMTIPMGTPAQSINPKLRN